MNDYFKLSGGEQAESTTSFDGGGGDFEPIPAKTEVFAAPEEVKWDVTSETAINPLVEHVKVTWNVLAPESLKGRKVFQKIWLRDANPKRKDKSLKMLAAIDANAGGELMALGSEPTDVDLAKALINKPMVLMLQVWKSDGAAGNWVSAVSPRNGELKEPEAKPQTTGNGDFDDDIPF